jgi:hypothetical protein
LAVNQPCAWDCGGSRRAQRARANNALLDAPRIGGLPLIRFSTERRLNEIMRSFEDDGCFNNNPHIFKLEDGGRFDPDGRKLAFRASVDPYGLMNPGKLRSVS